MYNGASSSIAHLFSLRDEKGLGRSMMLTGDLLTTIANVFITGTFYTGFLSENGIDIVSVGIITFIPYLSWVFALFTPQLMSHFKKRRGLLIFNHIFYYVCTLLATTVMPRFVADPGQRTLWFALLLFVGNSCNALVGGGVAAWQMHFIPEGQDRTAYFSVTCLISNLMGTFTALGAALLADALAGSPQQAQVLITMRHISFALVMLAGFAALVIPREYPYVITQRYRLRDVMLNPLRDRRFLLTALVAVIWNGVSCLNAGTWTFYLLNTIKMPYMMTYICTFVCAIGGIFLVRYWRRAINRYNWLRVLFVNSLVTAVAEALQAFVTARTLPLYVVVAVLSGVNLIGAQITVATIFYYNLPKTDSDLYITFFNFAVNIFMFLGSMLGTWLLAGLETATSSLTLGGMPVYGSQALCLIKAAGFLALCWYLYRVTPRIVHPEDAAIH